MLRARASDPMPAKANSYSNYNTDKKSGSEYRNRTFYAKSDSQKSENSGEAATSSKSENSTTESKSSSQTQNSNPKPGITCTYCKKAGHDIKVCRKLIFKESVRAKANANATPGTSGTQTQGN